MATATVALDQPWLMVPLAYGFAARVLTGPRLSPLGQLATRVITPRLNVQHRFVAGPPKRLAQGVGLAFSGIALTLYYGYGRKRSAYALLVGLATAAGLESFFGFCIACRAFPYLMRAGLAPAESCERCANIGSDAGRAEPAR
jgi:Domain of unknown function (DUF4395)